VGFFSEEVNSSRRGHQSGELSSCSNELSAKNRQDTYDGDYLRVEHRANVCGKMRTPAGMVSIGILFAPMRMSRAVMP
jgi:hypothetical protein